MRRGPARIAAGVFVLLGVSSAARAEPAHIFRLPREPVRAAILRFGVQAGVSVGISVGVTGAEACAGDSRPLLGVFTSAEALRRLLPAGCRFERIDSRAFRIVPAGSVSAPAAQQAVTALPYTATSLEELVVTAEKRREPLRGSPFAVSAVSGAEIEGLGAKSFADLALQLPGVAETNLGSGRNKIFIRGISDGAFTGRTQSTVGLYLDDVPITYNAPDPDLRLADVERVEVLRGPQGTLYGSGSIGGIVRIVTAKPDPARFAAHAVAEAMINQHEDEAYGLEAMVNLPVLQGRGAVRLVAYADELSGYLNNPVLGTKDVNHSQRSGERVSALADLSNNWRAQLSFSRQGIKAADSQYTEGARRLQRDTGIAEPHDNDFTQVSVTLSRTGSAADARISAAFIDHDQSTRYDATGAFDLRPGRPAAFDEAQRAKLWVAEALAVSASGGRSRWLVGAFGSYAQEASSGDLDATISAGVMRSVFKRRDRVGEAAVFGEWTYDLAPRLTATVGGRLFATRVQTRAGSFGLAQLPLRPVRARLTDEGFAPKVRLSYAFAPDQVLYVQLQDGFRAGGFNIPGQADGVATGPDIQRYRPDRLRSYEFGGETTLFDKAVTVRAAVFRASWRGVQTDQFRPSGLPVTLNIGDGSNLGVEVEAIWRPDAHWRLRFSGLFDEPELTRSSDLFPAKADLGLPGVAKRTASVGVEYRWEVATGWQAEVSAQAAYVGRSFLTFDGGAFTEMGGYGQGRIALSLEGQHWLAQAFVANVTDEGGNTFSFGNPFSRLRSRQETPLPPRTFGLTLRRRF